MDSDRTVKLLHADHGFSLLPHSVRSKTRTHLARSINVALCEKAGRSISEEFARGCQAEICALLAEHGAEVDEMFVIKHFGLSLS